ncbi:predicted protein [Lodderomyces elongisporus NRRL YB-4239]|uniref:Uncharacterized protein n=1 Tax=Lodderomyces elongisporus (strain ATCC 11503 / CBS 2605 / JCM 1781 / NBRC 1676 / NRRL YB-4239) TaxID=379508 RepID=A5DTL2_LODEL|nr:predicted protein [Lodderomyces elongisporus NRRL YB-4239]
MCAILQTETNRQRQERQERETHTIALTSFLSFLSCFIIIIIIIIIVIILKLTTIVAEHSKNYTGRESKTKNQEWRWFNGCAVGKGGGVEEGLEKIYTSNSFALSAKCRMCRMCRTCEAYVWVQKGNNKRILNKKNFQLSICLFWGLVELKGGGKREVGSVGREELILLL